MGKNSILVYGGLRRKRVIAIWREWTWRALAGQGLHLVQPWNRRKSGCGFSRQEGWAGRAAGFAPVLAWTSSLLVLLPACLEHHLDLSHPAPELGSDPLKNIQFCPTNSRCFSWKKWNPKFQRAKEDSPMQATSALCQKVSVTIALWDSKDVIRHRVHSPRLIGSTYRLLTWLAGWLVWKQLHEKEAEKLALWLEAMWKWKELEVGIRTLPLDLSM